MSGAANVISKEMRRTGPLRFDRFMELALYCPDAGYYDRSPPRIGRQGDYLTSVSVGPMFGKLLACQYARWLKAMAASNPRIVEAGAHDGTLACDIMDALREDAPDLYNRLEYCIIEPSFRRRAWQHDTLTAHLQRLRWFQSWAEIDPSRVQGIVFANELLDAMPVRRFAWDAGARTWFEWGVGLDGDRFVWVRLPESGASAAADSTRFIHMAEEVLDVLPDGFTVEVSPQARAWWTAAAAALERGWLLTFDYGLTRDEIHAPGRVRGTLRAYRHHRQSDDVLADPGDQDLTAHVDFAAIQEAGEAMGLRTMTLAAQGRFLTTIVDQSQEPGSMRRWSARERRQFVTLTHPEHFGARFRVLVQARGVA